MAHPRNLIIGTAGHIDHGKTVLVKALTGRDTDRLAEEKLRGISIDLGFAPLPLPDGSTAGIVDVPGHENFVRNMLAGATGVDLALLAVAADDGVMPQTREHLAILDFLGVTEAVVAVTKVDVVDEEMVRLVIEETGELLADSPLEGSEIVPVSAVTGEGLDELMEALVRAASKVRIKDEKLPARLPVDRVFTLRGIGTVATGTLWSGSIKDADRLELLPAGRTVRVRSLQVHDRDREVVFAGERVAVNLAGIEKGDISRGDVLAEPGYLAPTYMVDVELRVLGDWVRPLRRGTRLRFYHGTRETLGRMYPIDGDAVMPGEEKPAQLRLEAKAVCVPGDRFVIRSYSPVTTIGGGMVVNAHAVKHRLKDPTALLRFRILEKGDITEKVLVFLEQSEKPVTRRELVLRSGLPPRQVAEALDSLLSEGRAVVFGRRAPAQEADGVAGEADGRSAYHLSTERYLSVTGEIIEALETFHRENPLSDGMPKETLKKRVVDSWEGKTSDLLIDMLERDRRVESDGKHVRTPGATARITEQQHNLIEDIVNRISEAGAAPPTVGELAAELGLDRRSLKDLLAIAEKENRLVGISTDIFISGDTLREIEKKLREALGAGGITVSDFRKLINTSRKYALPLLEYFDRMKVTIRDGDIRRLRR